MVFISAMKIKELHCLLYLSIGLLNLPLPTDCYKIRLVGPTQCSGRVEILHRERWGTVCDDYWSLENADVVCRELSCGTALEAKRRAFFGEGKEQIWLDDVQCTGEELSLAKCPHRDYGDNNCGHGEDAGVVCSEHVRLINGTNRCAGIVEVNHDGHWRRVCNSDWGKEAAEIVCRQIGCGSPDSHAESPSSGGASEMIGIKTTCHGNETTLANCRLLEVTGGCVDTHIVCTNSKPLRLMNGTNRCSGRVEIFHDGQWGTVCDDRWGMQEAAVTCREMNCGAPLAVRYKGYFGHGQDQVWMDDVECTGLEKSLTQCPHRGFGENDCDHSEDAGVVCSDTLRLVNGTDLCSGRVEVYVDGHWGKVCASEWGLKEATLVCKEIDCGKPLNNQNRPHFGESKGPRAYTARCPGNESVIGQCSFHPSESCDTAVVTCTGNPQIRLVNGTDRCSGRVEVHHNGQWGTVCDDHWDIKDAQVVCRSLDCGTALAAKTLGYFGKGLGEIWMDDVECVGNETSLTHCQRSTFGDNNCGHSEDAGVVCSTFIRLINGSDHCSGRLEFYNNGHWYPVYDVNWGRNEAQVVCREMDCGDHDVVSRSFGQGSGLRGYAITCRGTEHSLNQCTQRQFVKSSYNHAVDATVVCTGNVKLVNGSNRCAGRVEFYHNGHWGTVCGNSWDINDAMVVCRQLNCGRAFKISNEGFFGYGSGTIWIDETECSGQEALLTQCPQRRYGDNTCNSTSIAGVICSESLEVRLVDSTDHCSGRVEVHHAGQWGTVCDRDWTMNHAEMICKLLECGHAVSAPGGASFGQGSGPVFEGNELCFANETSLQQCSLRGFHTASCGHEQDAGVVCAAPLRLVSGTNACSGRVEIFHNSQWGTVCDDEWEVKNAEVVCRQLGCGHAVAAPMSAHFGRGSGPIWLDNVECTGQESALTQCTHPAFGENNCGHGEDASVICLGTLPKPQITLLPGPEVNWGERVEIICTMIMEHLGGTFILLRTPGSFRMEKYSDTEAATFIIPKVDFEHKGSYHCEYQKRLATQNIHFPQGDLAELSVTVILEKPSISLTSPHAMVIFSPDNIEVTKGSRFSITCSIHSRYPGGFFHLTMSNKSTSEPKTAFGHSIFFLAYFDFPAVDYKHQGQYSCVYGVNISTQSFCSPPSKALQVTVIASSVSSVVSGVLGGLLVLLLLVLIAYFVWRRRGLNAGTMVRFSNRVGEAMKQNTEDKGEGAPDGRDYNSLTNDYGHGQSPEDKGTDAEPSDSVERNASEDLTGRVCYELEPLILS